LASRGAKVKYEASVTAKRLPFLGLLLLLVFATGCGEDCEEICESRKQCRNAESDVDCAAYCEEREELAEDADCTEQYDALNECLASQDDICNEDPEACESQSRAYTDCLSPHCRDHDCTN
jgi:hypothetical protein